MWGSGAFGEFLTPHRVKKIRGRIVQVSVGDGYGVAVTSDGAAYSWGENHVGQLGTGEYVTKSTPQVMANLDTKQVSQVKCGRNFVIALG